MMGVCGLNEVIEQSEILHGKHGTLRMNGCGDRTLRRFSYQCPNLAGVIDLEVWPLALQPPVTAVVT